MSIDRKKVNITQFMLVNATQMSANLLEYIEGLVRTHAKYQYSSGGIFRTSSTAGDLIAPVSGLADMFDIQTDPALGGLICIDPQGYFHFFTAADVSSIPFPNETGQTYYVGIRYNYVYATVRANAYTPGNTYEYGLKVDTSGEKVAPGGVYYATGDAHIVIDLNDGGSGGLFRYGEDHSGRRVRLLMEPPTGPKSDTSYYQNLVVQYGTPAGNPWGTDDRNYVTITNMLGQSNNVSTARFDYRVLLLGSNSNDSEDAPSPGVTITKTNITASDTYVYLGKITGNGSVITSTEISHTNPTPNYIADFAFGIEHHNDGTHEHIHADSLNVGGSADPGAGNTQVGGSLVVTGNVSSPATILGNVIQSTQLMKATLGIEFGGDINTLLQYLVTHLELRSAKDLRVLLSPGTSTDKKFAIYEGGNTPLNSNKIFEAYRKNMSLREGDTKYFEVVQGSVVIGSGVLGSGAQYGFLYLPSQAGEDVGTPPSGVGAGRVPSFINTDKELQEFYYGDSWVKRTINPVRARYAIGSGAPGRVFTDNIPGQRVIYNTKYFDEPGSARATNIGLTNSWVFTADRTMTLRVSARVAFESAVWAACGCRLYLYYHDHSSGTGGEYAVLDAYNFVVSHGGFNFRLNGATTIAMDQSDWFYIGIYHTHTADHTVVDSLDQCYIDIEEI